MCVGLPARVQTRPLGTERALPLHRILASGHAHCVNDCQAAKDQEHDSQSRLSGLNAVRIERSNIIGKPMAQLLLGESCTVTIAHLRTKDSADIVRCADIVVAVVRRPEMVPGGLGPMIIACLLANTPAACYRANDLDELEGLVA